MSDPLNHAGERPPICTHCNDTHSIYRESSGETVMCTWCPTPCEKCRQRHGAYCAATPCACACHASHYLYRGRRAEPARETCASLSARYDEIARAVARRDHEVAHAAEHRLRADALRSIMSATSLEEAQALATIAMGTNQIVDRRWFG